MGIAQDVLGEALVGAYLHGSAVLGGVKPTSDVDVLAVVDRPTTEGQRRELLHTLMAISDPSRAQRKRPVELTVVRHADVRPWHYPPRMEFQYGEWVRPEYDRGFVPGPSDNPDLAPLIAVVLIGNRPLMGPPPAELLDPVPAADLRRAVAAGIPELMADLEPDTRNVLLTLARIWHTTVTGEITSKDAAAGWVAQQVAEPCRSVILRARDQYLEGTHGDWRDSMAEARVAADEMRRAAGS